MEACCCTSLDKFQENLWILSLSKCGICTLPITGSAWLSLWGRFIHHPAVWLCWAESLMNVGCTMWYHDIWLLRFFKKVRYFAMNQQKNRAEIVDLSLRCSLEASKKQECNVFYVEWCLFVKHCSVDILYPTTWLVGWLVTDVLFSIPALCFPRHFQLFRKPWAWRKPRFNSCNTPKTPEFSEARWVKWFSMLGGSLPQVCIEPWQWSGIKT